MVGISVQLLHRALASAVAIRGLPSHRDDRHRESDDACAPHPGHTKLLLLRMQNILLLLLLFSHSSKFLKPGVLQFTGS